MNKMARGIMAGVGVALIVLSVLMMAGVVHAAEPETRATTQASQWVLVQNLTFDDTSYLNTFGVNGDTQNLSVSISGGYLNLSMKSPLIEDTQVWFFGFKPGPAKWVIKYEAHNASYTHLWIDGTRIWAMHAMETYDKNGNKIINYTHTDDKDQATIFIFNESKHITAYLNGVEVANVTDHTQFYMVPDANIMTMWNPTYIIFHSNTPASGWVKIDYIAEYVKTDPDYHLGATNYFFNRWDDGADSFFANGFNEFKRGWYGTMSVITGRDNWTNISKLAAAGWELADHTRDHLNLQSLNISQAEQEISDGNADLNAHGYNVSVWTAPYGSRNITLDQYAYNELGLRDIYVFNYWYYANSEMNFWEKWANHSEYYGAALGHQVMNTALTDPAYISSANFSKTINYIVQKRLFVVGFSQLWDMIENSLHGTITEQNTTDVKKFSVSGVGEWAEVAVKGDYTGYNITDGHGNKLWNFYKDGYTYILIKLDETKASYSGVVMIDPSSPTSSAPAGTTNPTGGLQLNFTPLNIMLFIVGIGMVAASRRRW